ncbi:hypothetical protein ASD16_07205 [Cellulomonas sp. Root485]|uniref:D-Ala-D-Ala carboxypeptidase family metallohydrolase n=1 Tax=Cellulomonas sp. Root485 TaxID=1736546 RepID=UPI0006FD9DB0|nr:D-Ala-D-Ala carboxypeptidase family metallohydrolase [Cellulomonas sp. Root485]KQY25212.1 hypothetical protein ASD16_07205 [Cellulomonas sp. Root485]
MAGTTENGWPKDPRVVRIRCGGDLNGAEVREGDVAIVAKAFLDLFHERVEPITEVNGFRTSTFNDSIAGSIKNSNHVSGTAWDVNGGRHKNEAVHPNGWRSGFTPAQVDAVRTLLAQFGGLLEWGMDFAVGKRDPMHVAVARGVTQDQIAALAASLRSNSSITTVTIEQIVTEEEDMRTVKNRGHLFAVTATCIQEITDQNEKIVATTLWGAPIELDDTGMGALRQIVNTTIVNTAGNLKGQGL